MIKRLKLYSLIFVTALSLSIPLATGQQRRPDRARRISASVLTARGVETITAAQMRSYLSFVASDEMEGRDTPSRGLDLTAKFMAMNLERWGFKAGGDDGTFFQKIALRRDALDARGEFIR